MIDCRGTRKITSSTKDVQLFGNSIKLRPAPSGDGPLDVAGQVPDHVIGAERPGEARGAEQHNVILAVHNVLCTVVLEQERGGLW